MILGKVNSKVEHPGLGAFFLGGKVSLLNQRRQVDGTNFVNDYS